MGEYPQSCGSVGLNGIPGHVLRACTFQLARVFTDIFNLSLSLSVVPSCFKKIHHYAHTTENKITCLNDWRPFALTHNCTATHSSNIIVKFADDTTGIGLITGDDETAYREEVSALTKWCQENHLSLNIDKTKELVVDFRRQSREHTHTHTHTSPSIHTSPSTPVEQVNSFKFLGVHITEDLTWSAHTDAVLKKAHHPLFFLRWLRQFSMSPSILRSFYTCTVESILTGCITAWFGKSTAGNSKAVQRVLRTAPPHCWRWCIRKDHQ